MNLILFANHFPYNRSEPFLINEFEFAKKKFSRLSIYTLTSVSEKLAIEPDRAVEVHSPVFADHKSKLILILKGLFNLAPFKYHLRDLFANKLYKDPAKLKRFFTSLLVTRAALSTGTYRSLVKFINESDQGVILYFYWGDNLCWTLPYLQEKIKDKNVKTVIRLHRTDLYEYVTDNYAPLRRFIFEAADKLVPISQDGFHYLSKVYPEFTGKVTLSKLGVFDNGLNPFAYNKDSFTLVSVSFVTPVKRVELVFEALKACQKNINWYHFGDGPLFDTLKDRLKELPSNIKAHLMGYTVNHEVMAFYKNTSVDLFINVSSSEGLPVSIMEAASFGIPVMATNAGGTSEIVNSETGVLLPVEVKPVELAFKLNAFFSLPYDKVMKHRSNARKKYETELNAVKNYEAFYNEIMIIN